MNAPELTSDDVTALDVAAKQVDVRMGVKRVDGLNRYAFEPLTMSHLEQLPASERYDAMCLDHTATGEQEAWCFLDGVAFAKGW